ncbi:asialoglycoprotein receptor 2-like [Ruditapes philippinarum]|uniref:asialoglycoprotein receptor 2-like n=1 Tax=Ruditapes philippinarum TaxID=129788 RepID=UPI00295BB5C5|nr:asialoglycoprotein receptor 2-like [Ruditapes philippinarum]
MFLDVFRLSMLKYSHILRILSLLLISHCLSVSADGYGCELQWQQLHRSCVHFITDRPGLNWQEARDHCKNITSDLLSIDSRQENKQIKELVKYYVENFGFLEWWIGIRQVNGTWQWVDGEEEYAKIPPWAPASDSYSDSREDSNVLSDDKCAVIDDKGKLREKSCIREKRPFICEKLPSRLKGLNSQSL